MVVHEEVLNYFKSRVLPEHKFLTAKIIWKKTAGPKEPRFLIEVSVEDPRGRILTYAYNYKRLLRSLGLRDE